MRLFLHFPLFCWRLLTTNQHGCYNTLRLFSTLLLIKFKFTTSERSVLSFHHDFQISKDLYLFFFYCFLWYHLCSQMISTLRTIIRLVFFSLQAVLNKYENCAIWIPENEYCLLSFHLKHYSGSGKGKSKRWFTAISALLLQHSKNLV